MKITKEIVKKTAHLARLNVDQSNEEAMMSDLQKMVDWVDELKEVDTENIEPLTNMSFEVNSFREDKMGKQLSREKTFKNAPVHNSEYFRVPKVIK